MRSLLCPHIPHGIHMESIWIPCNSRWIPSIPYGICFGWYPEVFTLPPYSTWNPYGFQMDSRWIPCNSRWIPSIPYGICFGWDLTHFGHSIPLLFHMESTWNCHIPLPFHHSIWNVHVESTWNEYGFHMDSTTIGGAQSLCDVTPCTTRRHTLSHGIS